LKETGEFFGVAWGKIVNPDSTSFEFFSLKAVACIKFQTKSPKIRMKRSRWAAVAEKAVGVVGLADLCRRRRCAGVGYCSLYYCNVVVL